MGSHREFSLSTDTFCTWDISIDMGRRIVFKRCSTYPMHQLWCIHTSCYCNMSLATHIVSTLNSTLLKLGQRTNRHWVESFVCHKISVCIDKFTQNRTLPGSSAFTPASKSFLVIKAIAPTSKQPVNDMYKPESVTLFRQVKTQSLQSFHDLGATVCAVKGCNHQMW